MSHGSEGEAVARRAGGAAPALPDSLYQLHISLTVLDPPIWRRVQVRGAITLQQLHQVIQTILGWRDYHLWSFSTEREEFGPVNAAMDMDVEWEDAGRVALYRVAPTPGSHLTYTYDYGDNWEHQIVVEKIRPPDPAHRHPVCLEGEYAAPPEDSGGPWGYAELLGILADPAHPEHDEYREWLGLEEGEEWDPHRWDKEEVNRRLRQIRYGRSAKGGAAEPDTPASGGSRGGMSDDLRDVFAQIRAMAEEVLRANPQATLEEMNAAMRARSTAYNRQPQRELGGLAPEQLGRLLADAWEGEGVLRLSTRLALDELAGSQMLQRARTVLAWLQEKGKVRATAAGNLPRAAVAELLERIPWPTGYVEKLHEFNQVLNEQDVFPLHLVRLLLDLAGLIKLRTGSFSLTRRGAQLLAEQRAGELFALLFRTHFRKLNLAYLDQFGPEATSFQQAIAYSLYRFRELADDWREPEELAPELVLPAVRAEIPRSPHVEWVPMLVRTRLLQPLEGFALVEVEEVPAQERALPRQRYRKAPLFDRFLSFRFSEGD